MEEGTGKAATDDQESRRILRTLLILQRANEPARTRRREAGNASGAESTSKKGIRTRGI
jgi:hypothetical protein